MDVTPTWHQDYRFSDSLREREYPLSRLTIISLTNHSHRWCLLFLRDIYVLKLGADLKILSYISVGLYFWSATGDSVSGWAQDKFKCCFSDKYGRLTPWVFVHFIILIGTVLMAYCVPADFSIIEIWFAIVSVLGAWCNSTIFVCYYTALTALFPYKEQRSQVHGSTMLIALPGVFVGVFIYSMSLSDASTSSRFGYAIVSCIFIALCLLAGERLPHPWIFIRRLDDDHHFVHVRLVRRR